MYATSVDNVDAVECILAAGAEVSGNSPHTALHMAASKGSLRLVQVLLGAPGVDVNAKDTLLQTPLHAACMGGSSDVVRLLLAHGADAGAVGKNGWTPLHRAASKGFTDICQMLVEAGADPCATLDSSTSKKMAAATPKSLADAARHIDTAAFLLRAAGGSKKTDGAEGGGNGGVGGDGGAESTAIFQKIAALKASPTVGTTPQVLRKRAAEGHARAKSIAVQREEEKTMGASGAMQQLSLPEQTINIGSSLLTPVPIRPTLQKKPNSQNLLSSTLPVVTTVPEIIVTSPRSPGSVRPPPLVALSGGARGLVAEEPSGRVVTIPLSSPASLSPKISSRPSSPLANTSASSMVGVVRRPGSPRGAAGAAAAATGGAADDKWQEEAEELRDAVKQLGAAMQAMGSRIKFMEMLSAVFGVLLLVSIMWR